MKRLHGEIARESIGNSRSSGHYQEYLFFHRQKNCEPIRIRTKKKELAAKRAIRTLEIASTDRATCYLRYRDDLCPRTARFSNFVGVSRVFSTSTTIKKEGKLHCHVGYASPTEKMWRPRRGSQTDR